MDATLKARGIFYKLSAMELTMQTTLGSESDLSGAFLGTVFGVLFLGALFYVYFAVMLTILARKSRTPNAWLAWVPFGNLCLMCRIGQRPAGWAILLLIPLVNLVMGVIVWMGIAKTL